MSKKVSLISLLLSWVNMINPHCRWMWCIKNTFHKCPGTGHLRLRGHGSRLNISKEHLGPTADLHNFSVYTSTCPCSVTGLLWIPSAVQSTGTKPWTAFPLGKARLLHEG